MSPYPMDRATAVGPMRLVLTSLPDPGPTDRLVRRALASRLAACAQATPIVSRYWWKGKVEESRERLVVFKTAPKYVGALFRFLEQEHPYDVPEIIEIDVPRVNGPYLRYLADVLDAHAPPAPLGGGAPPTRPPRPRGSPRGRGARSPGRTRARRPRPY